MIAAIYGRVSTSDRQEIETQLIPIREYAKRRGFTITREYLDIGQSGAKASRPALDELMIDAHQKRFEVVLVYKLDRISRSLPHFMELGETFRELGIQLISVTQPIDTTTSMGKAFFNMMGIMAELERDLLRERVRDGINRARQQGVKFGRPRKEIDEKYAWDLRKQGLSLREISKELKVSTGKLSALFNKPTPESGKSLSEEEPQNTPSKRT